jgi:2-polyprenyl-3-methyl-5-hydroxy-6-metoxy-1,4-benzoquinol methylase
MSKNCIICKSNNVKNLFFSFNTHGRETIDLNEAFAVFKCFECGNIFIDIEVDKEYYKKFYKKGYYADNILSLFDNLLSLLKSFSFFKKQQLILKNFYSGKKIKILDVGCGSGDFLVSLNKKIFDRLGLEMSAEGVELSRGKKLEIYNGDILTRDFGDEKFDVITLWHVLEHITDPEKLFIKIHDLLNEKGLLVFQVPNSTSLGFNIGEKYWFHLDSPRHLWIPNKIVIKFLSDRTQFSIIKIKNEFYDYPLDLFWSVRKYKFRFFIYLFYPIFKVFSQEHLTFVLKKNEK